MPHAENADPMFARHASNGFVAAKPRTRSIEYRNWHQALPTSHEPIRSLSTVFNTLP
jgi:hypothetical protein